MTDDPREAGPVPDEADRYEEPHHDRAVTAQLLGVLSHELRSPISAILGYQELLAEGIFGPLDPRAAEAIERIGFAAVQLLNLADGIVELASDDRPDLTRDVEAIDIDDLIAQSVEHLASEGAGRGVTLEHTRADAPTEVRSDRARLRRIVDLALAAAVKASPGATIRVTVGPDHTDAEHPVRIDVHGVGLDLRRDAPVGPGHPIRSGVALRLAMARRAAHRIGANLTVEAQIDTAGRIAIHLPAGPPPTGPAAPLD
jgi:signal transduction histidine kinase